MADPLTEAELAELPNGVPIDVKWSGGNGPHRYELRRTHGFPAAYFQDVCVGELSPIGAHPLTQVWRVELETTNA